MARIAAQQCTARVAHFTLVPMILKLQMVTLLAPLPYRVVGGELEVVIVQRDNFLDTALG